CLSLEHGFRVEPGQWWFFAAALAFALVFVTNSHVVRQVPVLALGTVQLTMVAVLILPLSWTFEAWPDRVATSVLGWALASALLGTTARFIVQLHAQGMTTPSHAAVILMLEPMWTAIVAAWWFGESMSMLQFLGCGLIFLALVVSRWSWIRGLFAS
nr:DMT family transporter [Zoogloeaceae bacterium]